MYLLFFATCREMKFLFLFYFIQLKKLDTFLNLRRISSVYLSEIQNHQTSEIRGFHRKATTAAVKKVERSEMFPSEVKHSNLHLS